jgi:hypothetical protein
MQAKPRCKTCGRSVRPLRVDQLFVTCRCCGRFYEVLQTRTTITLRSL